MTDATKYVPDISSQFVQPLQCMDRKDVAAATRAMAFNTTGEGDPKYYSAMVIVDDNLIELNQVLEDGEVVDGEALAISIEAIIAKVPEVVQALGISAAVLVDGGLPDEAAMWLQTTAVDYIRMVHEMRDEEYQNNLNLGYFYIRYIEASKSWMVGVRFSTGSTAPLGVRKMFKVREVAAPAPSGDSALRGADSIGQVLGSVRLLTTIGNRSEYDIALDFCDQCEISDNQVVWSGSTGGGTQLHKDIDPSNTEYPGMLCLESELSVFLMHLASGMSMRVLKEAHESGEITSIENHFITIRTLGAPVANLPASFVRSICKEQGVEISEKDALYRPLKIEGMATRRVESSPHLVDVTFRVTDPTIGLAVTWNYLIHTSLTKDES